MRSHSYENDLNLHENEPVGRTHFHMNGFALRLVLIQRQNGLLGKWSIKIFIDLLLLLCLCPKALPCYKLTAFRFFSYSIYLLSFPFSTIFCTSFSFSLAELFAVLDESERLLGEIDGLTKQNQHKVSPWLVFPNTHTDYRRSVYALK